MSTAAAAAAADVPAVCREWCGELHGAEGQQLAWVTPRQLHDYAMPAADIPLVNPVLAALAADTR